MLLYTSKLTTSHFENLENLKNETFLSATEVFWTTPKSNQYKYTPQKSNCFREISKRKKIKCNKLKRNKLNIIFKEQR